MAAAKRLLNNFRQEHVWSWLILACVLLFVAGVRWRLLDLPLERDEGEYAYGGQLLLRGILPGQLLYTMKLPGTHAAYAVLMAFFGQSCAGVHLGFLFVNWATIVLLFLFARSLLGVVAGLVAATTYTLLSLSGDVLGTAAHATHFVMLFAVGGLFLLWRAPKTGRGLAYFGSGLLLGTSVLMKHNGLLFATLGAAWVVWLGCSKGLGANVSFLKAGTNFVLGLAAPFVLLVLLLWRAHTLEQCWLWSVSYARAYAQPNPGLTLTWRIMMQRLPHVLELPLYATCVGLVVLWWRTRSKQAALFITAFFLVSFLAVIPGLHFRPHYYVLLAPGLALVIGALVQLTTDWLRGGPLKLLAPVPVLLFGLCFAKGVAREQNLFSRLTPAQASRSLYSTDLFTEALVAGGYIRDHSPPQARVAVLGSEPEIYFYSRRLSATGYIYTYPLLERQPFAAMMRSQMKEEILAARPEFIVQVRSWTSWKSRPGAQQRLNEIADDLMPPYYDVVGFCDFDPNGPGATWHWTSEGATTATNATSEILIFRRATQTETVE